MDARNLIEQEKFLVVEDTRDQQAYQAMEQEYFDLLKTVSERLECDKKQLKKLRKTYWRDTDMSGSPYQNIHQCLWLCMLSDDAVELKDSRLRKMHLIDNAIMLHQHLQYYGALFDKLYDLPYRQLCQVQDVINKQRQEVSFGQPGLKLWLWVRSKVTGYQTEELIKIGEHFLVKIELIKALERTTFRLLFKAGRTEGYQKLTKLFKGDELEHFIALRQGLNLDKVYRNIELEDCSADIRKVFD